MRRLARHIFTLCLALSLLLCVAVCVLWVRSGSVRDGAETSRIRREADGAASAVWFEVSSRGRLWLRMSFARVGRPGGGVNWDSYYARADATGGRWRLSSYQRNRDQPDDVWGGVGYGTMKWGPLRWASRTQNNPTVPFVQRNATVGVSHWFAVVLLAILPAWTAWRRICRWLRRREDLRLGLCQNCGYDLRASPERCPECGAAAWSGKMKLPTHGLRRATPIHCRDF